MNQQISSLNLPNYLKRKFRKNGFYHCQDVENSTTPDLLSLKKPTKTQTATELWQNESNWELIKTSISELDDLLEDKVMPGLVTELCGLPGSGRTQICLYLSVGAKGQVVFIHTNQNFSSERLRGISFVKIFFSSNFFL